MNNIYIECPDGFVNQLRLSLAANYLVSHKIAKEAKQKWILNNHNTVDYNKYFYQLKNVQMVDHIKNDNSIKTQSFTGMLHEINNNKIAAFRESYKDLKVKENFSQIVDDFVNTNDISNTIGIHIRTGCKTALLLTDKNRKQPINQNSLINQLLYEDLKIFLATDNQETQNKWKSVFGSRLICFAPIMSGDEMFFPPYDRDLVKRHTSDDHTVADFLILQRCKKFIGSNESSFSLAIKWIRNNYIDHNIGGVL